MNRSGVIFGILAFIAAGGYLTWNRIALDFPVERTIRSAEGKALNVIIQGKLDGILVLERVADGERFEVPVQSLSFVDRLFVMRLPDQPILVPPPAAKKPEDRYIANRLELIKQLRQKSEVYLAEIASRDPNDTLYKLRVEQLAGLKEEIKALEASIEVYKSRTRKN